MKWYFIQEDILTEDATGFTIRLNSGTWLEPVDITPDKSNLTAYEQAKYLRLGLAFANEFISKKLEYTSSIKAW